MIWVKIRSWHLRPLLQARTLCGRVPVFNAEQGAEPPADAKTCERCFQIREGIK